MLAPTITASGAHMDDSVERFLESLKPSTSNTYRISFQKHFLPFLGQWQFKTRTGDVLQFRTFKEVLDEITRDQRREVADKEMFERELVKAFVKYVSVQSPKSQTNRVAAIQSCAKYWGVVITTKWTNLPDATAQTESYEWSQETIAQFNALLRTPKYRAFDAFCYQSGLAKADVLARHYRDIKKNYEAFVFNNEPVVPCFRVTRGKTGVHHNTCISDEAMMLTKVYFDVMYGENGTPEPDDRIFDLEERPINEVYVDRAHKMIGDWPYNCPMGPHSKRKAFRNALVENGCPSEYAEYFMGHALGNIDKTYSTRTADGWAEVYMKYKQHLSFPILTYEDVRKALAKTAKSAAFIVSTRVDMVQ